MSQHPERCRKPGSDTPVLSQAVATLRALLESGRYQPGDRLPPHHQLAESLSINHVTLQQAMEVMRNEERIVRHRGCGTFVAETGRRPAVGTIAVVTRAWFDPNLNGFDFACARAVVDVLADTREAFHFYPNQPLNQQIGSAAQTVDPHLLNDADQGSVRGVLVLGEISLSHPAAYRHLRRHAIPVVEMSWSALPGGSRALLDYPRLAADAMAFVRREGRATVGWLGTRLAGPTPASDPLWRALRSGVNASGLSSRREWQREILPSQQGGYEGFMQLWKGRQRPQALVVTDDVAAAGVARAMVELGVEAPRELLVVAHANVGAPLHYPLPFCRIGMDATAAVRQAWELLNEAIRDPGQPPREVLVAPQWLERGEGDARLWRATARSFVGPSLVEGRCARGAPTSGGPTCHSRRGGT